MLLFPWPRFPHGEPGWNQHRKKTAKATSKKKDPKLSIRDYYAYRTAVRREGTEKNAFTNRIVDSGRLFCQYVTGTCFHFSSDTICGNCFQFVDFNSSILSLIDMYCKMEDYKLLWQRTNQTALRADLYQGLCDAVNSNSIETTDIGKRVVLPASFVGSPRQMCQLYQDSMAIVR